MQDSCRSGHNANIMQTVETKDLCDRICENLIQSSKPKWSMENNRWNSGGSRKFESECQVLSLKTKKNLNMLFNAVIVV